MTAVPRATESLCSCHGLPTVLDVDDEPVCPHDAEGRASLHLAFLDLIDPDREGPC